MLTRTEIKRVYPARYPENNVTRALAEQVMNDLWAERNAERGRTTADRSGSCKFAALLARELFGGRLAGNLEHVFVIKNTLGQAQCLDLNREQNDALALGDKAHIDLPLILSHPDYRESLSSCLPRVARWVTVFEARARILGIEQLALRSRSKHAGESGLSL